MHAYEPGAPQIKLTKDRLAREACFCSHNLSPGRALGRERLELGAETPNFA